MARNKSGTRDPEADRLYDEMRYSVEEQANDIARLGDLKKVLDATVDENVWPTRSKIPLPLAWSTTEAALGPALEGLFPPTKFLNLIPDDDVDPNVVDKVSWALYCQIIYKMKLKYECARSIKDSFSLSVGYGIVEPITVTPPASFITTAGNNSTRQMGDGVPVRALRYRYLSAGKVMPYPQGTDFNGNNATPMAFLLDVYTEREFRDLYEAGNKDGEDILLKGDMEAIINESKSRGFTGDTQYSDFMDDMAGRNLAKKGPNKYKNMQASVPVLKCYEDGKITWMFLGGTRGNKPQIIFEDESYAARRKPLIKFDPWIDSDRWFPMSQAEADKPINMAKNIWFNAVFDLMTQNLKRPIVFDSSKTDGAEAAKLFRPRGIVGIDGDVRQSAAFLAAPGIDVATMQFGDIIDGQRRAVTGEQDFGKFNSTRGGSMAFQDLVQSSTGRDRLRLAMLEMGGLESTIRQTLTYLQVLGSTLNLKFQRPEYKEGKDYIEQFSVTEDEIRHAYELNLDLGGKRRLGSMDLGMKMQLYSLKRDNPFIRQWEATEDLFDDEVTMHRQRISREEAEAKQREREAAELEAIRNQGARAQGGQGMAQAAVGAIQGGQQQ